MSVSLKVAAEARQQNSPTQSVLELREHLAAIDGLLDALGFDVVEKGRRLVDGDTNCPAVVPAQYSPAEALERMTLGLGTRADIGTLGVPVRGARLLLLRSDNVRALDTFAALCDRTAACVVLQRAGEVVALLGARPGTSQHDGTARVTQALFARLQRDHAGQWHGALGVALTRADQLAAAYRDVVDALLLLRSSTTNCVRVDDEWANLAVARLRRAAREALPEGTPLTDLRRYDTRYKSELVRTLTVWLQANGNAKLASDRLQIHPNTLRYRLKRAAHVGGFDLDNADALLVCRLLLL